MQIASMTETMRIQSEQITNDRDTINALKEQIGEQKSQLEFQSAQVDAF